MYLDAATHNLKGGDESYKYTSRNALGGLLVHTHFFDVKKMAFTPDLFFMVITLPSTGLDGPVLTLTSDEVWGADKLVHLLGLQVTNKEDKAISLVCDSSECLSGQSPTPLRITILQTPLVWRMHGEIVFSVVSVSHSMANNDDITGWLGVKDLSKTQYHCNILFPSYTAYATTTSVFDLLPMALHLPFKHGLPVGYLISGKVTAVQAIKSWNVFAGEGDNSHERLDTPFFHRYTEVMSSGSKKTSLCWGQSTTYDREPPSSQSGPLDTRISRSILILEIVARSLGPGIRQQLSHSIGGLHNPSYGEHPRRCTW
jgi:hypothetical protein